MVRTHMRVDPANFPLHQPWEEIEHGDGRRVSTTRFVHVLYLPIARDRERERVEMTNGSKLSTPTLRILEWKFDLNKMAKLCGTIGTKFLSHTPNLYQGHRRTPAGPSISPQRISRGHWQLRPCGGELGSCQSVQSCRNID